MSVQQDKLQAIYTWLLGGFSLSGWPQVLAIVPHAALGIVVTIVCGGRLNVLQLDEEQAAQLGINVERMKVVLLGAATLATAAAVSVSGLIGFVGLIVPHAVRLIWGPNYRLLLPLSTLLGATFLVWADTLARTVLAPSELPVGVVTALCGAPFFLYILRQRKRMVF
ncbi:MAG: iron ABC transporter permease [Dehalococcoidales bacterium]|nr:iron ABC transporter permease [Dehalococcoidales bacterium]